MLNNNRILDMDFSTDFTRMVDTDIEKCTEVLSSSFEEKSGKTYMLN